MAAPLTLAEALERIRDARDHCAEHGDYPPPPLGPDPNEEQAFDDWAADLADTALDDRSRPLACQVADNIRERLARLSGGRGVARLTLRLGDLDIGSLQALRTALQTAESHQDGRVRTARLRGGRP